MDATVRVLVAAKTLDEHMTTHVGRCLTPGSFAGDEFDRLYLVWIQARWDCGDDWVRSVWKERP